MGCCLQGDETIHLPRRTSLQNTSSVKQMPSVHLFLHYGVLVQYGGSVYENIKATGTPV